LDIDVEELDVRAFAYGVARANKLLPGLTLPCTLHVWPSPNATEALESLNRRKTDSLCFHLSEWVKADFLSRRSRTVNPENVGLILTPNDVLPECFLDQYRPSRLVILTIPIGSRGLKPASDAFQFTLCMASAALHASRPVPIEFDGGVREETVDAILALPVDEIVAGAYAFGQSPTKNHLTQFLQRENAVRL